MNEKPWIARPTWRASLTIAVVGLWIPLLVALALNHQLRRSWMDIWFWPGALPGRYFIDSLYHWNFVFSALLNMALWTLVGRRWRILGGAGALLHSTLNSLYLTAVFAM